jgi:hypothetical protein
LLGGNGWSWAKVALEHDPAPEFGAADAPRAGSLRLRGAVSTEALSYRSMPQPPTLTPEQRTAALAKAAQARKARAELKDHLKTGRTTLKELLGKADKDETVGKMKVLAVLESLPGTGKVKARRLMETVGISETRRLQGLGAKQRDSLLEAVERP